MTAAAPSSPRDTAAHLLATLRPMAAHLAAQPVQRTVEQAAEHAVGYALGSAVAAELRNGASPCLLYVAMAAVIPVRDRLHGCFEALAEALAAVPVGGVQ